MRKKFSIKESLSSVFSGFRGFNDDDVDEIDNNNDVTEKTEESSNLTSDTEIVNQNSKLTIDDNDDVISENEYDEDNEDDEDNNDENCGESKRERKRRLKQLKKERKKSFFRRIIKKRQDKPKMPIFVITVLLLFATLFVYSIAYLLTPTCTLTAKISVVYGGYNIEYMLCERPLHLFDEDVKVGDEMYFTQNGTISKTPRNGIKMRVSEIVDDVVYLDFVASGVPKFISTKDMQSLLVESQGGKQVSRIYIKGKIVANRFSLLEICI